MRPVAGRFAGLSQREDGSSGVRFDVRDEDAAVHHRRGVAVHFRADVHWGDQLHVDAVRSELVLDGQRETFDVDLK